ncbi:3-keto-5-aminohexanoate cleavage protein [Acidovorax sp. Leaf76]|uniref:3-keto-5-aminohexanoate cleavage protein n=1 Tax=unclassified Acidovorax TaxID=2684926 RepID=UPI0006FB3ED6|nr:MULTISPECIES: 3-keto-5-aminohexanoate cleavage protein [unclassified Acidovorax]KQO16218.1 3-keto-5-aminohexanoate cleavage protein [Acidovorax sp. Leaf76]KQO32291.1 3-keto-5-aminohexanoate cleavage protein [Acidovorax sp. Leaf84]KQS31851.1 3-keto-5-aminohexanoate cleavage protein [Acidovorax sp. Leaf191]
MTQRKVIVTIAPTGGMAHKSQNPHLPTQPAEIAEDVQRCWNAGASVVAIHARRPDDGATCNADIYRDINTRIRAKGCDIVINNSTGGGVHGDMVRPLPGNRWEIAWEERIKGMDAGAEMCTLDATTLNLSFDGREILMDTPLSRGRELAAGMKARGIKPEWEVFSPTHILQDTTTLIDEGHDDDGPHFINLVMNVHRAFQNAMPYSPRHLQMMVDTLPQNSLFCVSGIGPSQLEANVAALLLGGHARVGLEDNLYYRHGELATNVQLTERIVRVIRELGMEPATPAEARALMGLPRVGGPRPEFAPH